MELFVTRTNRHVCLCRLKLKSLLIRTLELVREKNIVFHASNSDISSAMLPTRVTCPFFTSSMARERVPLRVAALRVVVVRTIDTPFRLFNILRNPGSRLLSSIFNTICVISFWIIMKLIFSCKSILSSSYFQTNGRKRCFHLPFTIASKSVSMPVCLSKSQRVRLRSW